MQCMLKSMWQEDDGVLSFEWTMLAVIVVFGIVGGLAAARDAILDEMGDMAEAYLSIDQSFTLAPFGPFPGVTFMDMPHTFTDCDRGGPIGQFPRDDVDS
jgi:Flp pilus assembly pilin Flp